MLTGSIIDFYDDPTGQVLKQTLPHDAVPDFIKTASFLPTDTREKLPDDVFALVALDRGAKMRKFACTDKGNTALSVIYFMENHNKLPAEAQKVAAANLCEACGWYDMVPPEGLLKAAGLLDAARRLKDKVTSSGKGAARVAKDVADRVNAKVNSVVEKEVNKRVSPVINKNVEEHLKSKGKKILRGAAIGAGVAGAGAGLYYGGKALGKRSKQKTASVLQPYVDITGLEAPPQFEKRASVRMAGHLPIDSYGEVMEAQKWFNDNPETIHPEARRDFCVKLASRADEVGIPVADRVRKYAGEGFAPDGEVKVAVATRMQFWAEDAPERGLLNGLMDKYASVQPEVFCEALKQFDQEHGLDHYWDDGVYDPWYSTYGFQKTAQWEFSTHGDKINEEQLKGVANAAYMQIAEYFGKELADELRKEPVDIFDSLPLDSKRIIMRIANDPQPSGQTFNP